MSALAWLTLVCWAPAQVEIETPGGERVPAVAAREGAAPRAFHVLSRELHDALKQEAAAASLADRADAVYKLADLFTEIVRDPRRELSPTLKQYHGKIRSRLLRVRRALEADLRRHGDRRAPDNPADDEPEQLTPEQTANQQVLAGLAEQMALSGYAMGGPAALLARGQEAFGGGRRDDGAALVELIQRTISPQFWDVNGGPGTIMYYAPLQVLVVRATGEVHERVGGLNRALREAGM